MDHVLNIDVYVYVVVKPMFSDLTQTFLTLRESPLFHIKKKKT